MYVTRLCELITSIDNPNTIIVGDFNFRNIDWTNHTASGLLDTQFWHCTQVNFLHQMISKPTHEKYINDLLLTTDDNIVHDISLYNSFGSSDHKTIEAKIQLYKPTVTTQERKVYLYGRANYVTLQQHANTINWNDIMGHRTSLEDKWLRFTEEYNKLVDIHIPYKFSKPGYIAKAPWLSYKSVKKSRKQKRTAKIKFKTSGLHAHKISLQVADEVHQTELIKAKLKYEEVIARSCYSNPRRFFNYAKAKTKPKSNIDCLIQNNNKITDDNRKAELLNNFFASVMTEEPTSLPLYCSITSPPNLLSRIIISEDR